MSDGYYFDIPSAPRTATHDAHGRVDLMGAGTGEPRGILTETPTADHPRSVVGPGPLVITVHGTPAPQGSKRHVGNGVMIESSKKVKPWREAVKYAALDAMWTDDRDMATMLLGPVHVSVTFRLPRPKGHYRTGKNAHLLRDGAPVFPAGKPDLDKLLRSTLDALGEAAVFRDDAQVVLIGAGKVYADQHPVGAVISVSELT